MTAACVTFRHLAAIYSLLLFLIWWSVQVSICLFDCRSPSAQVFSSKCDLSFLTVSLHMVQIREIYYCLLILITLPHRLGVMDFPSEAHSDSQQREKKNSVILSYWTHWSYLFIWITGSTDFHRRAHTTHATVFKTDLWSSGRADGSIWTCIITSQCFSEVASMQEVLLLVFELCCLLRFMGEPVGFLLEDAPHHTVWAWEQTLLVWRHAAYASPLHLWTPNAHRKPQPTTPSPSPGLFLRLPSEYIKGHITTRAWFSAGLTPTLFTPATVRTHQHQTGGVTTNFPPLSASRTNLLPLNSIKAFQQYAHHTSIHND